MTATPDAQRRPGTTLYRYMMRAMVFPTLYTLFGLTLAVLTKDLLGYTDLVVNRGLGAGLVGWIAFYRTVPLATQMLPFSMLVGALVALGRMGADREILALEASGLSAPRLVGPIMAFAGLVAVAGFALSLLGAPAATRALDRTFLSVAARVPGAVVRAGEIQKFDEWRLEAREVSADGRKLGGVVIYVASAGRTIFAERAELITANGTTEIALERGGLLSNPRGRPRMLRFDQMRTTLPSQRGIEDLEREGNTRAGDTLRQLWAIGRSEDAHSRAAREALTEFNRRFALPAASLVFGLLLLPLFLTRAPFSRGGGAILGLAAILVYYGLVQVGNGMIRSRTLGVAGGVWLPNVVLSGVALILFANAHRMSAFGRHLVRPQARPDFFSRLLRRFEAIGSGRARRRRAARDAAPLPRLHLHRFALQRYVSSRFLQVALLCFSALALAYVMVDILERLQQFAKYDARGIEILRFYVGRVPVLASRVVPMALLVASSLTVALLGLQGELTAIRSCGIPAPRALLPLFLICAVIVPLYFVLDNSIVPRAEALADYVKATQIKDKGTRVERPKPTGHPTAWYRIGNRFLEAERFDPTRGTATNIAVYELGPRGLPVRRSDAREARHIGGGVWRLTDTAGIETDGREVRKIPVASFAELGDEVPAEVDTEHLSLGEIRREIQEAEANGYSATAYHVDYFAKLARPLACLVLPAVALFFGLAGPPFPSAPTSLVFSAVVAVSYTLLTGVGISLGYGGALPPVVAGSAATAIFAALALYFGIRLRGLGQRL